MYVQKNCVQKTPKKPKKIAKIPPREIKQIEKYCQKNRKTETKNIPKKYSKKIMKNDKNN